MEAWLAGLTLLGLLTLPGWAMLTAAGEWQRWAPLQRWCLAVGLSLALYPVLFYGARLVPGLTIGPLKLAALLSVSAGVCVWGLRRHWRAQVAFDRFEWLALGIIGLTLLTRFWIVRHEPFPAWTDSLHHTLLTELTAAQGRLPISLEPYFPVPLGMYHLGLYSLAGSVQMLSGAPAHTALLWTAQTLNGLCGLGVYLVLDRKVGRLGALTGLVVVGLASRMPGWYVNWGRFTQLAGQTLVLTAWLVSWEALAAWRRPQPGGRAVWLRLSAALLTASTFLMHFRVAIFAAPLFLAVGVWEIWRSHAAGQAGRAWREGLWLAVLTGVLAGPVLGEAVSRYLGPLLVARVPGPDSGVIRSTYYEVPLDSALFLAGSERLLAAAAVAGLVGLWRRNRLVLVSLGWIGALLAMGFAYVLGIPLLNFTNLGAVLIMFYLPIGLAVGAAVQDVAGLATAREYRWAPAAATGLVLVVALIAAPARAAAVEPFRYFVTPADLPAMDWIRENTAPEAVFAVNTTFWLPRAPHGTDAGYWIPYLTGRRTTAGVMLMNEAPPAYLDHMVALSQAEEQLEHDLAALTALAQQGVQYLYVGARGDFTGPGLNASWLSQAPGVRLVYDHNGVSILALDPADLAQ